MATLTVAKISGGTRALSSSTETWTGLLEPTKVGAAAGGDQFPNDGRTVLEVLNGGGGSINVTVVQQNADADGYKENKVMAVANGATLGRRLGPFEKNLFDDANGNVQVTYSGVTSVTVAAVSLAQKFSGN